MQAPAAGWYQDPQDPRMVRWWDGAVWTEHTHAHETVGPGQQAQAVTGDAMRPGAESERGGLPKSSTSSQGNSLTLRARALAGLTGNIRLVAMVALLVAAIVCVGVLERTNGQQRDAASVSEVYNAPPAAVVPASSLPPAAPPPAADTGIPDPEARARYSRAGETTDSGS